MGQKGAKLTEKAVQANEKLLQDLADLGDVSSRKMFGGFGIFESGAMFALITPEGNVHFKVDDSNRSAYEEAGSGQHMKMPYFEVPSSVLGDGEKLKNWARDSIAIARASKKTKK